MSSMEQLSSMEKYHAYLEKNYKCGVERFFSPTGALKAFQKCVEVSSRKTREVVVAKSAEDAANKLKLLVDGGEGVYDLTSEPGSGKTSVLPFSFPTKKVVVALPTPFDAWSAFQMASGEARLKLKGLSLGKDSSKVCYTDSYLAANMVLAGFMDYDLLIVDECDSGKGVTKFLADVGVEGKVIIRMSASHGRSESGPSRAFTVTEDVSLPDVRAGVSDFVGAVKKKLSKRSMILMPDAQSAKEVSDMLPGSKLVCSGSNLKSIAESVLAQKDDQVYVADDVCARGLNLNLDVLVDAQLVTEHGVTRNLSKVELYQRKGRVGRNKSGWYVSPGLPTIDLRESEADVLRSNVMRAVAGIVQDGPESRHLTVSDAEKLIDAEVEPITVHRFGPAIRAARAAGSSSSASSEYGGAALFSVDGKKELSSSDSNRSGFGESSVSAPGWLSWLMPNSATAEVGGKRYYVSKPASVFDYVETSGQKQLVPRPKHRRRHSKELVVAESAPYAVVPKVRSATFAPVGLPDMPPQVDLTEMEYHMDWPSALKDCAARGGDLPTIVPPNNWRHTSTGGLGTNWYRRLETVAVSELTFAESEFEVVCRAWNKMVAESWVKRTPGLSSHSNEDRLEFCLRYFQSYFLMYSM